VVKRGASTISISDKKVSDDGTKAVLTAAGSIVAAEYTVTFGDKTATFTGVENKLASIEITGTNAVLTKANVTESGQSATVSYKALNAFGEDISAMVSLSGSSSLGSVTLAKGTATITITDGSLTAASLNMPVSIAIYDTTTGISTSATVTLSNMAVPYEIEAQGVYNEDGKALTATSLGGKDTFYFLFRVKDQYGNYITDKNKLVVNKVPTPNPNNKAVNLYINYSAGLTNTTVGGDNVKVETKKVDGVQYFAVVIDVQATKTASSGTANIIIIPVGSGKSLNTAIEVGAGSTVATINVTAPANVKEGAGQVEFSYTAYDAQGNEVTNLNSLKQVQKGNRFSWVKEGSKVKLYYNVNAVAGSEALKSGAYITEAFVTPGTLKTSLVTFTIKDEAIPYQIIGINDGTGNKLATSVILATGAGATQPTIPFDAKNFDVVDQYGDKIKIDTSKFAVYAVADEADVFTGDVLNATAPSSTAVVADKVITSGDAITAAKKGSVSITFYIVDNTTGNIGKVYKTSKNVDVTSISAYTETFSVVEKSQFKSYEVSVPETIYSGSSDDALAGYRPSVKVYGVVNSSQKVLLTAEKDYNFSVGSKIEAAAKDAVGNITIKSGIAKDAEIFKTSSTVEGSFTVTMNDGTQVETKVNISNAAPKVASIVLKDNKTSIVATSSVNAKTDLLDKLTIKDSYGFTLTGATDGTVGLTSGVGDYGLRIIVSEITDNAVDPTAIPDVTKNGSEGITFVNFATNDTFTVTFKTADVSFSTAVTIQ
uniref:hypothetical protein n=1 Tax=Anaerolentibacter hominis TaxID=3079009 RepID=UPI0031B8A1DA